MKKTIVITLCIAMSIMLFGCYGAADVEIYLSEIPTLGGYKGEPLAEFNADEVLKNIEHDNIEDGKETETLSLLESEAVNKRIHARLAQETGEDYTVTRKQTYRVYLDNGDVAVLYIYDITYTVDEADADTAAFDNIGRIIVVMVKK